MRRRVLMVAACPFPTAGGTQVYVGQLASNLVELGGHDVHLLTYGIGAGDLAAFDAAAPYRTHRAPAVPGHRTLAAGPTAARPIADALLLPTGLAVLGRHGPFDLIHAHNYEGAIAGAILARLTDLPLLYHGHNLMGDELETYTDRPDLRRLARRLGHLLDLTVPPLADRVVAVSQHTADRLAEVCGPDVPVAYVPPAVDFGQGGARAASGRPTDVVYTGNLDGYQGIEVMLDAVRRLKARRPVTLTLVTADPTERVEAALAAFGLVGAVRVVRHDDFEVARRELEGAKIALLPRSVASGFPIKLLNYLAAGCPTVACRGSAQGLGAGDGVIVVPDGDGGAMAQTVAALLDDAGRRERLADLALAASARFTWPVHVDAIDAVYHQLLGEG